MARVVRWLADTSVIARLDDGTVRTRLAPLLRQRLVAVCPLVDLELGRTARTALEHEAALSRRRLGYPQLTVSQEDFERALEVQRALVEGGRRTTPLPDLLIAAVAERYAVTVLHYDRDYDHIAAITNQPAEWVAPPGTLDRPQEAP